MPVSVPASPASVPASPASTGPASHVDCCSVVSFVPLLLAPLVPLLLAPLVPLLLAPLLLAPLLLAPLVPLLEPPLVPPVEGESLPLHPAAAVRTTTHDDTRKAGIQRFMGKA